MSVQRVVRSSLRRVAAQNPVLIRSSFARFASPAAIALGQFRPATSSSKPYTEVSDPKQLLARQRLNRPVSPHLAIYRPQITWYLSALNRITGSVLSGGMYVFAAAYLVAPAVGWHLESASLVAAFGALPIAAKFALKFGVAMPFTFHCLNGVRHLIWDMGKKLNNKQVISTGWTVVGLSVASAFALALI
ncbi:cytochrome b subunit of succinate dehydrogenase, Sdh3p [Ophidiomyces ophidiicola]|nr:cytochrome b subunit of succinate dehydrogenase, Sdh3p [Ophidiomyces ophidiicola]